MRVYLVLLHHDCRLRVGKFLRYFNEVPVCDIEISPWLVYAATCTIAKRRYAKLRMRVILLSEALEIIGSTSNLCYELRASSSSIPFNLTTSASTILSARSTTSECDKERHIRNFCLMASGQRGRHRPFG